MKRKMVLFLSCVVFCAVVLTLFGCGSTGKKDAGRYPVTVGESTVSSQPTGVVVLSDNLADVTLALGYEGQLVGKGEAVTQESLATLPNFTLDDATAMVNAGATVVLLEEAPTEAQQQALEASGITPVVLSPANNRETLQTLYKEVGLVFRGGGVGDVRGEKAGNNALMMLDDIERSIPVQGSTPTACYLYDLNGTAATGDTFVGFLFSYAGLQNIFSSGYNNSTEGASIVAGNPQYIFCAPGLKTQILNNNTLKGLSAVKNGRVYEIDPVVLNRQGDGLILGLSEMAGKVYPELLEDGQSDENLSAILEDNAVVATTSSVA